MQAYLVFNLYMSHFSVVSGCFYEPDEQNEHSCDFPGMLLLSQPLDLLIRIDIEHCDILRAELLLKFLLWFLGYVVDYTAAMRV